MTLLVSIHDVAPPFEPQVRELWSLCSSYGVRPALLVVPRWHGAWHLEQHPRFTNWVYARADEGAKIFLHGDRHDEVGTLRSPRDWARAAGRTAKEGEFLTLDYEQARERIARGMRTLNACGLVPLGFVPPAWLARDETRAAARDEGLAYSEDTRFVWRLSDATPIAAPAVRWSARTRVRAVVSARVSDVRWHLQRHARYLRLALHPTDLDHPATRASLVRAIERWLGVRDTVCYSSLAHYQNDLRRSVA